MKIDLFERLKADAHNRELQVQVAAQVASKAAIDLIERIDLASADAVQAFTDLMKPYRQDFGFYSGLEAEFVRRSAARLAMSPFKTAGRRAIENVEMFGRVAEDLVAPHDEVRTSPLVKAKPKKTSEKELHTAFHLLEFASTFFHESDPVSHMIGPILGLALGFAEHREHADPRDPFAETAKFLRHLVEIETCLRRIAVGVYRVPDFWPDHKDLAGQRELRKNPTAESLKAAKPLPRDESVRALDAALLEHRKKG